MAGIIPADGEVCEGCEKPVDEEDGYVLTDEAGSHRYCDDCPA